MSKKRLRATGAAAGTARPAASKLDPDYWRKRLFKCRYTYKGKRFEVRHWSAKIQVKGERRTYSLQSGDRGQAAAEACELYRGLMARGSRERISPDRRGPASKDGGRGGKALPAADKFRADYWGQRLIHRPYTMNLEAAGDQELSVRVEHAARSYYFPLGTDNRELAAKRALQIYETVARRGWEVANKRFSRELTVAFRWLDNPLAWTYTTIHTQGGTALNQAATTLRDTGDRFRVGVAEPDAGIRPALEWCLKEMDGFCCAATFTSAEEVLRDLRRKSVRLVLVSHNLTDRSARACLDEMRTLAPEVAGVAYSVYEDSEELFRTTPGGAGTYLLRRTPSAGFLEPIAGLLKRGGSSVTEMAAAVWQHFKDSFVLPPTGAAEPPLANLTQREHEVLALLSKGHPDKDIADQLGISVYTVHEHVRNIFEKLQVHNRTEAVVKFLQK
jgi:DNA-binding NarL/FixJ family response regulator